MGYFNPMLQFGIENFCSNATIGIDGLIPDLPVMFTLTNTKLLSKTMA
jgi:tryptophan synthase alpha chain